MKGSEMKPKHIFGIYLGMSIAIGFFIYFKGLQELNRGLPSGYYLEVSNLGNYRACRISNNMPLFVTREPSSKIYAIRRAWRQYESEMETRTQIWVADTTGYRGEIEE